jgi:hypothetical protein
VTKLLRLYRDYIVTALAAMLISAYVFNFIAKPSATIIWTLFAIASVVLLIFSVRSRLMVSEALVAILISFEARLSFIRVLLHLSSHAIETPCSPPNQSLDNSDGREKGDP